jgi:DNA-binding LacI/PurR family transcriptional regulator
MRDVADRAGVSFKTVSRVVNGEAGVSEALADDVRPAITVVPQHPLNLGARAAELLFRRIEGHRGAPTHDVIANEIIARGSGEIPPPR